MAPPKSTPTPPPAAPAIPPDQQFVHLHLHTEYSLLDGGNKIDRLVNRVAQLGMNAVGITDHGNIFGTVALYQACKEKGIKAILGVEAYVAQGPRQDRTYTGSGDGGFHLVLLAENNVGWQNLLVLCSEAYLTGFYYKPRIDRELLAKHSEGLIAINGHLGSEIGDALLDYERTGDQKHWEKAVESAVWHKRAFGESESARQRNSETGKREDMSASSPASLPRCLADSLPGPRFFVELQHHISEQNSINKHLIRLAKELDLPLVCDNDAHFLKAEDHDAHDTLVCISTGKGKQDEQRMRYPPQLYVKSPGEMRALAEDMSPEVAAEWATACDNTVKIAERCNVKLPLGANNAPMVRIDLPKPKDLPRHDAPEFAGDLTAWYKAYCAKFELKPFTSQPTAEELQAAKVQCDEALRMLAEAGFIWRYGPGEVRHSEFGIRHSTEDTRVIAGSMSSTNAESRMPNAQAATLRHSRLNRELKILADKNISAYFLIVWDFVNWGRQRGIPALARGSGVGTMVGYTLGLSNACPVQYGLLFERFTDPDRSEYPDIDIDLCQDGRGDVINYVRQKYGHVAQIITFGTMKARAAVRDVGRVFGLPLPDVDRIAKLIPEALGTTLDSALTEEPDLKKLYDSDERIKRLIDNARTLEGQARHASVHAAGVIVATRPLHEIVPLYKQSGSEENEIVTQWDGPTCEKMGLLKMDFLGLRTLSVIERAKKLIRESLPEEEIWRAVGQGKEYEARQRDSETAKQGGAVSPVSLSRCLAHPLDLDRLDFTDQRVFEMFRRGDTTGVFQFESGGMRRLLVEMKPDRLEDLIAANALFRPGPMDLIPDYNRRKHGQDEVPKVHPIVEQYTAETYGVMVYQEQVMQIVHGLGGISLRNAYSLIKAISKKKQKQIDAERPTFVEGAVKQGLTKAKAEELFELILKFAGYGFNKSHSTGYAIVAYQTAYLKTFFPNQYMAAFLTFESAANKVSEWIPYLEDCRRTRFVEPTTGKVIKTGVEVRPPDVNLSDADFTVVYGPDEPHTASAGHVRFGLGAIKGAGEKAIEATIAERSGVTAKKSDEKRGPNALEDDAALVPSGKRVPFTSMFDFCERVLARGNGILNKATIEALVRCGAFDSIHGRNNRAAMVATIEQAVSAGQKAAADKASGQGALFGFGGGFDEPKAKPGSGSGGSTTPLAKATPWTEAESLANEKEVLGFYISSHPLDTWKSWYSVFATANTATAKDMPQDTRVILPGLVQSLRQLVVKTGRSAGQKMAIVTFEDTFGAVEAVVFTDAFAKYAHLLDPSSAGVVFLLGRLDRSRGDAQVIVERVVPIDGVPVLPGRLQLILDDNRLNGSGAAALKAVAEIVKPKSAAGPSGFPLELVVLSGQTAATLQADPRMRVGLDPAMVREVEDQIGPGTVRVVNGVTAEAEKGNARPWEQKRRGAEVG